MFYKQDHNTFGVVNGEVTLRYVGDGTPVAGFTLRVNDGKKQGDGFRKATWIKVSVFGKSAEYVNEKVKHGMGVMVEDWKFSTNEYGGPNIWTDNDGNPRASFEVMTYKVNIVDWNSNEGDSEYNDSEGTHNSQEEDDVPF